MALSNSLTNHMPCNIYLNADTIVLHLFFHIFYFKNHKTSVSGKIIQSISSANEEKCDYYLKNL